MVAADGITYEKAYISDWLYRQDKEISPVTGHRLAHRLLLPNDTLRCVGAAGARAAGGRAVVVARGVVGARGCERRRLGGRERARCMPAALEGLTQSPCALHPFRRAMDDVAELLRALSTRN